MICPICSAPESKRWLKAPAWPSKICYRCYKKLDRDKHREYNKVYKAEWYKRAVASGKRDPLEIKRTPEYQFSMLKSNAKRRGISVDISFEDFSYLRGKPCYYNMEVISDDPSFQTSTWIDRLDSKLGYQLGNVVPCCPKCNYFKRDILSPRDTIWAMRSLRFYKETGTTWERLSIPLYTPSTVRDRSSIRYSKLVKNAESRNLSVGITEQQYLEFIRDKRCHQWLWPR